MRHSPLTFHEELEDIMEQMQDEDTSTADRLDISISLAGLLLLRIDDLQDFILSTGLTDKHFNAYMERLSNVTYH